MLFVALQYGRLSRQSQRQLKPRITITLTTTAAVDREECSVQGIASTCVHCLSQYCDSLSQSLQCWRVDLETTTSMENCSYAHCVCRPFNSLPKVSLLLQYNIMLSLLQQGRGLPGRGGWWPMTVNLVPDCSAVG